MLVVCSPQATLAEFRVIEAVCGGATKAETPLDNKAACVAEDSAPGAAMLPTTARLGNPLNLA